MMQRNRSQPSLSSRDLEILSDFGEALLAGRFWPSDEDEAGMIGRADRGESVLAELQAYLPVRLPPLYERLILEYSWPELEVGPCRLLANPPGPDLYGLLIGMQCDPIFWSELPRRGWVQIGKGPDICYDPVCFDIRKRSREGDFRVVQLDHEALLCDFRIREVTELATSFDALLERLVSEVRPVGGA